MESKNSRRTFPSKTRVREISDAIADLFVNHKKDDQTNLEFIGEFFSDDSQITESILKHLKAGRTSARPWHLHELYQLTKDQRFLYTQKEKETYLERYPSHTDKMPAESDWPTVDAKKQGIKKKVIKSQQTDSNRKEGRAQTRALPNSLLPALEHAVRSVIAIIEHTPVLADALVLMELQNKVEKLRTKQQPQSEEQKSNQPPQQAKPKNRRKRNKKPKQQLMSEALPQISSVQAPQQRNAKKAPKNGVHERPKEKEATLPLISKDEAEKQISNAENLLGELGLQLTEHRNNGHVSAHRKSLGSLFVTLDFARRRLQMHDPGASTFTDELQDMIDVSLHADTSNLFHGHIKPIQALEQCVDYIVDPEIRPSMVDRLMPLIEACQTLLEEQNVELPEEFLLYRQDIDQMSDLLGPQITEFTDSID